MRQRGFTLMELVAAMLVLGAVAAVGMVFIRTAVQSYADNAQRGELDYIGAAAQGRFERELGLALPNSVRVASSGGDRFLEFIPLKGSGRYRAGLSGASGVQGDALDAGMPDGAFDVLAAEAAPAVNDYVVVNTLAADAYAGANRGQVASVGAAENANEIHVALAAPVAFPATGLTGHRFHLAGQPVSYKCANPGVTTDPLSGQRRGAGELWRYENYGFQAGQPVAFAVPPVRLADRISECSFSWLPVERMAVMRLTIESDGERQKVYAAAGLRHEY